MRLNPFFQFTAFQTDAFRRVRPFANLLTQVDLKLPLHLSRSRHLPHRSPHVFKKGVLSHNGFCFGVQK
ncbi:hypothetical protein C4B60_09360 [Jeotgalibacillus proteolyticus]|uniref:Uncharacterized protein n=1 Tax=Jeotgalibacillus proteolyticus TaxID=2082395 RepID=A0A2S5GDB1_9BACL|nr:hypothetical protein C4B60_09360 [Jeotgalibacillus proteolyticus]